MLKTIVQRAGIIDSKIVAVPLKLNQKLSTSDDTPIFDLTCCQQVVGCLAYLTITGPDIAYPVKVVSWFVSTHTSLHWIDFALHSGDYELSPFFE